MSIKVTNLTHTDFVGGSAGTWSALDSTDGMVTIYNWGPCVVHVNQASDNSHLCVYPGTYGVMLKPGDSVRVPSDDGTSGTRIGMYLITDSFLDYSTQVVTVVANGG